MLLVGFEMFDHGGKRMEMYLIQIKEVTTENEFVLNTNMSLRQTYNGWPLYLKLINSL